MNGILSDNYPPRIVYEYVLKVGQLISKKKNCMILF